MKRREGGEAEQTGGIRCDEAKVAEWRCAEVESDESSAKVEPSLTSAAAAVAGCVDLVASGRQAHTTHPFGHVASVRVVVMVLQDHHGGDDRHPHDDHDAGKVLT